jgi:hypothetical protein
LSEAQASPPNSCHSASGAASPSGVSRLLGGSSFRQRQISSLLHTPQCSQRFMCMIRGPASGSMEPPHEREPNNQDSNEESLTVAEERLSSGCFPAVALSWPGRRFSTIALKNVSSVDGAFDHFDSIMSNRMLLKPSRSSSGHLRHRFKNRLPSGVSRQARTATHISRNVTLPPSHVLHAPSEHYSNNRSHCRAQTPRSPTPRVGRTRRFGAKHAHDPRTSRKAGQAFASSVQRAVRVLDTSGTLRHPLA